MGLGPLMFLHRDAKWHESNKTVHKFIDKYVDEALERKKLGDKERLDGSGRQRPVLLDAMAEQSDDKMQLRNEALQAFIAAHETTACLISNIFYMLARHPLIWKKLREEVLTLGEVPLDFEVPMKLKYLRNVINESKYSYWCIIELSHQHSLPSSPPLPRISLPHPRRPRRHHPPQRRRCRRPIPHLCPSRRPLQRQLHRSPPLTNHLGPRCRRVQPRPLGELQAEDVGICSVWRGTSRMRWETKGADGNLIPRCEDATGF